MTDDPRRDAAAYGGANWRPRTSSMAEELGSTWSRCGVDNEYGALRAVVLHRPGPELEDVADADAVLMLDRPDASRSGEQHDGLAQAYRNHGVEIVYVDPLATPPPNQMFCADLFVMTPAGAIVGRPASTVRAGEERWLARRLADRGVPILRTVGGRGTFEGADVLWLDPGTVLLGRGLRTNAEGAAQVAATLAELGVEAIPVDLPHGSMHLMGELRFADRNLAFARPGRTPWTALDALRRRGYDVRFFPDESEMARGFAHNFVTLGPRTVLMPSDNPRTRAAYEAEGIDCVTVELSEIHKCAGGIGCLSGILERDPAGTSPAS